GREYRLRFGAHVVHSALTRRVRCFDKPVGLGDGAGYVFEVRLVFVVAETDGRKVNSVSTLAASVTVPQGLAASAVRVVTGRGIVVWVIGERAPHHHLALAG